jgi:hypothetical protein
MAPPNVFRDPSKWPVRVFRRGSEPGDDLSGSTTAAERLDMVATLSQRAWELTGKPFPTLPRSEWPVRIIRQK